MHSFVTRNYIIPLSKLVDSAISSLHQGIDNDYFRVCLHYMMGTFKCDSVWWFHKWFSAMLTHQRSSLFLQKVFGHLYATISVNVSWTTPIHRYAQHKILDHILLMVTMPFSMLIMTFCCSCLSSGISIWCCSVISLRVGRYKISSGCCCWTWTKTSNPNHELVKL